jgi:hypothetical protein
MKGGLIDVNSSPLPVRSNKKVWTGFLIYVQHHRDKNLEQQQTESEEEPK